MKNCLQTSRHEHNLLRIVEKLPIPALVTLWNPFWGLLETCWPHLGRSWALLGVSWASLGRLLSVPWAVLRVSWFLLGFLCVSWAHLDRFGIDFGRFQGGFGKGLDGVRTLKFAVPNGVLDPWHTILAVLQSYKTFRSCYSRIFDPLVRIWASELDMLGLIKIPRSLRGLLWGLMLPHFSLS